jgi:septum formation protein
MSTFKIILGSQSPRRKELLQLANIPFEVKVADVDETIPSTIPASIAAQYLAEIKNNAIFESLPTSNDTIVITADTIVIIDDEILGKPKDLADAKIMLQKLSGRTHQVITGVCIKNCDKRISGQSIVNVCFNTLTDEEIDFYLKNYKTADKAGSYAIQEWIGAIGIKKIEGDFYAVMGLPISWVYQTLKNKFNYEL